MNASSKKRLTQYERLAGILRDRIASGTYARGDKLPSEMELMDESGLSRSMPAKRSYWASFFLTEMLIRLTCILLLCLINQACILYTHKTAGNEPVKGTYLSLSPRLS